MWDINFFNKNIFPSLPHFIVPMFADQNLKYILLHLIYWNYSYFKFCIPAEFETWHRQLEMPFLYIFGEYEPRNITLHYSNLRFSVMCLLIGKKSYYYGIMILSTILNRLNYTLFIRETQLVHSGSYFCFDFFKYVFNLFLRIFCLKAWIFLL